MVLTIVNELQRKIGIAVRYDFSHMERISNLEGQRGLPLTLDKLEEGLFRRFAPRNDTPLRHSCYKGIFKTPLTPLTRG